MNHKSWPFEFKSLDDEKGTFEATVAVFDNVDKGGDRIKPGAFVKTLAQWEASGDPIPVIFNHDWATPDAHVGVVEKAMETSKGLLVRGRLDIDDNPVAKQVHRLMQRRSLKEFSFGYSVPKGGAKRAKDGAMDLVELELAEVGPTLKGMNPATELHSVKNALGVDDKPDAGKQDEAARRLAREVEGHGIPDVPTDAKADPPDVLAEVETVKAALTEVRELVKAATAPPAADPAAVDAEAKRVAREVEELKIPDVPEAPKAPETDVGKELQEVKGLLAEMRAELEALRKKADEADKEPERVRSADPLRKQADAVALEIASDGQSLRKPPKTVEQKRPEPSLSIRDLKRQMRDEMLGVLSGGIE